MSERIDFSDRGLITVYEGMASGNVRALEQFLDSMEVICRKRAYKPLVDFTNKVIEFYDGEFRSHVMACFNNWRESDSSLERLALKCGAGQGAANTGRQLMSELGENLQTMFQRSFSPVRVDTDVPVLEKTDILETNGEITRLIHTATDIRDNALGQCRSMADQNMLYSLISPVIRNTGDSICQSFQSMIAKVTEGAGLYELGVRATLDAMSTGAELEQASFQWPAYDTYL